MLIYSNESFPREAAAYLATYANLVLSGLRLQVKSP
jgi:hypothetical protein